MKPSIGRWCRWCSPAALLCGGALAAFGGAALAQRTLAVAPVPANESRVALVIGNSAYRDAPLRNPTNDAADMAEVLRSIGFAVTLRTNADTRQMRGAIREFAQNLKRGGVGLFYFAGHGIQSRNGRNYLIPVGSDLKEAFELEDEAVDANRVLAGMEEAGNRVNIVILDACRNNPFARAWRSAANGLAQMNAPTGSFIGFATAPGSIAADGAGRNGIYTKHLLENLKRGDPDIDKVFTRVTAAVARETANKQVPWKSSSLTAEFVFRPGAAQLAAVAPLPQTSVPAADPAANERAFWESVKDSRNADELKAYLDKFPGGLFSALAQTRLRALQAPPAAHVASVAPSVQALAPTSIQNDLQRLAAGTVFRDCTDCPEMVVIPPGRFTMGSPENELERWPDGREGPQHSVAIPQVFAAGKFEVTRGQFARFASETAHSSSGCNSWNGSRWDMDNSKSWRKPGFAQTESDPVVCVSWEDAKAYAQWLARKAGKGYRLLTEAEWEYAARAGSQASRHWGDNANDACRHANVADAAAKAGVSGTSSWTFHECSDGRAYTAPVGSYQANAFGLHDMIGNAWEWTEDCWNDKYAGAPSDGSAWASGDCGQRVLRGGSWSNRPRSARSANRDRDSAGNRIYSVGFRLARTD